MHISGPPAVKGGVRDALKRASLQETGRPYMHIGHLNLHIPRLIRIFETLICTFKPSFAYSKSRLHCGSLIRMLGSHICIFEASFA